MTTDEVGELVSGYTQTRIRLSREGAQEVLEPMLDHERYLLRARRKMLDAGQQEQAEEYRSRLKQVRRVIEEVRRAMDERDWGLAWIEKEPL